VPIYEYRCEKCGEEVEYLQRLNDKLFTICPRCEEPALKKKVSVTNFSLVGGGWAKDGYKGSAIQNDGGSES